MLNSRPLVIEFTKEQTPAQRKKFLTDFKAHIKHAEGVTPTKRAILEALIAYSEDKLVSPLLFNTWTAERADRILRCADFFKYYQSNDLLFSDYVLSGLQGTDSLKDIVSPAAQQCKDVYMAAYIFKRQCKPLVKDICETLFGTLGLAASLYIFYKTESFGGVLLSLIGMTLSLSILIKQPQYPSHEEYIQQAKDEAANPSSTKRADEDDWNDISQTAAQAHQRLSVVGDRLSVSGEAALKTGVRHGVNFYSVAANVIADVVLDEKKSVIYSNKKY